MPTYRVNSTQDLKVVPISAGGGNLSQMLMNVAKLGRKNVPLVASQLNIQPVFDVNADVQGRDLASAANDIDKVLDEERPAAAASDLTITLSGQVETMRESLMTVLRHGHGGCAGLPRARHQFSELD